ncbi:PREDICTED: mavicyanin-like [Tarenaya hassleriana]|uniref:mavicyanin-like n=1 Tax=Tarenaya hassleriana TaxID=28532 RepID=UPI00053C0BF2|nr:PREDICTED: mavicyanin-like [Tarenaya hassleriana]
MEIKGIRAAAVAVAVAVAMVAAASVVEGKEERVGGSSGWTILGNVDYSKWASSHTFYVGDSLLFVYNSQFHNVKQVSRRDFHSCNASSAIATYTSGSDTVPLKRPGHYYFLCGFPGHCQAGQKVHVIVTSSSLPPTPAPAPSPFASAAPEVSARNDAVSSAVSRVLAAAVGVVFFM